MIVIFLIPIFFLLFFRLVFFKGGLSPVNKFGDFVFLIYFFPLVFGFVYALLVEGDVPSIWSMIYLSVALFSYFFPLFFLQSRTEAVINLIDRRLFKILCLSLIVGGVYSILVMTPKAIYAFEFGADEFRKLLNTGKISVFDGSILETVAVGFSTFFGISQLLAFLVLATSVFGKKSSIIAFLLVLSSCSYILNSLAFAGRDGVVFWAISFLFCWVFVRRWVRISLPPVVMVFIVALGFSGLIVFLSITFSRFDSAFYVFAYGSQQLHEFDALYRVDLPNYDGWVAFGDILSALNVGGELDRDHYWNIYLSQGVVPWNFSFFVGSFIKDFGKLGAFFAVFIPSMFILILMMKKTRRDLVSKVASLDRIILVYLYSQVGFMGVFYFKHSSLNFYLIVALVLVAFFAFMKLLGFNWFLDLSSRSGGRL